MRSDHTCELWDLQKASKLLLQSPKACSVVLLYGKCSPRREPCARCKFNPIQIAQVCNADSRLFIPLIHGIDRFREFLNVISIDAAAVNPDPFDLVFQSQSSIASHLDLLPATFMALSFSFRSGLKVLVRHLFLFAPFTSPPCV